jgi:hypothetical protein
MDKKMIIVIVISVLIAIAIIYSISMISTGQVVTGQAIGSTANNLADTVGSC